MKIRDEVRIAVTGVGIVCSIGRDRAEVWQAICDSRDGIGRLTRFGNETFPTDLAAEVQCDLRQEAGFTRRQLKRLSRTDLLAVAAARQALEQADRGAAPIPRQATLVSSGSSTGGLLEGENYYFRRTLHGRLRTPVSSVLQQPTSGPTDAVARLMDLGGGVVSNATACASAGAAIGLAADYLRGGYVDAALAGGSDALCRLTYSGFNVLQAVDPRPCVPFDTSRQGITLGEGAAYVMLERWDDAVARGAEMLGEFCGYGASCDAYHPTAPAEDGSGAAAAMRGALLAARADRATVHYVNAHGTGTLLNDSAESRAILDVLGPHVPTSSTKSYFGHTLGASGALEAVITILAVANRLAPPTLRLDNAAADCGLDHIAHTPRPLEMQSALSNTFGFGGSNVSLLFRAVEPPTVDLDA